MIFRRPTVTTILGCMIALQVLMLIPIFNSLHSSTTSTHQLSTQLSQLNAKVSTFEQQLRDQGARIDAIDHKGSPVPTPAPTSTPAPAKKPLPQAQSFASEACSNKAMEVKNLIRNTKAFDGSINDVPEAHRWRYDSKDLYWQNFDDQFCKFVHYNATITSLPPKSVHDEVTRVKKVLLDKGRTKLAVMFEQCYPNTLSTTAQLLPDGTVYAITGDIPLMWLRDSSAQVHQYLPLTPSDPQMQIIIEGLIRRDLIWIKMDPYGSSYRMFLDFDHVGKKLLTDWDFKSGRTIHVAMHNYEIDSLCYVIRLSHTYWKLTGIKEIFNSEWKRTARRIIDVWRIEQDHESSNYTYPELTANGRGTKVCKCGLTWVGFRPSDDQSQYHFFVPGNMFAIVALQQISEIAEVVYGDSALKSSADSLAKELDDAIHAHAIADTPDFGKIYAYEVDGCGGKNLMDDANVPSLLSIEYLGYKSPHDPTGQVSANTRKFVWSRSNPWFFESGDVRGIGSPHTGHSRVWPMSLIMKALTTQDPSEINQMIDMLEKTDAGTNFMHESFTVSNPQSYTRHWFAWANSLFSEMILKHLDKIQNR